MRTNGRSIKTRMARAESALETRVEKELVSKDIRVARQCWSNLVDWAHEVYKIGGFGKAVDFIGATEGVTQFTGMMPGWNMSALLNQVYGIKGGADSLLYPLSKILEDFFDQGGLSEELKTTQVMMGFCGIIKEAHEEILSEAPKNDDNNL